MILVSDMCGPLFKRTLRQSQTRKACSNRYHIRPRNYCGTSKRYSERKNSLVNWYYSSIFVQQGVNESSILNVLNRAGGDICIIWSPIPRSSTTVSSPFVYDITRAAIYFEQRCLLKQAEDSLIGSIFTNSFMPVSRFLIQWSCKTTASVIQESEWPA